MARTRRARPWKPCVECIARRCSPTSAGAVTAPRLPKTSPRLFFSHFIEDAYHAHADPARGSFPGISADRTVKRFLIDSDNEAHAAKRGGGFQFKSLEQTSGNGNTLENLADSETPERAFERSWAVTLLDAAMGRLRDEAVHAGKQGLFEQLSEFLTERPDEADYARVAGRLEDAPKYARRRRTSPAPPLARADPEELAQTTTDRADLESELREMRLALGAAIG